MLKNLFTIACLRFALPTSSGQPQHSQLPQGTALSRSEQGGLSLIRITVRRTSRVLPDLPILISSHTSAWKEQFTPSISYTRYLAEDTTYRPR